MDLLINLFTRGHQVDLVEVAAAARMEMAVEVEATADTILVLTLLSMLQDMPLP